LIQNEDGVADLYDTGTLQSLEHLSFPERIVDADFVGDGSLYVLTADQNVYQLNVNNPSKEQQRAAQ
jgi:outer membrane protein assembly factor BamB